MDLFAAENDDTLKHTFSQEDSNTVGVAVAGAVEDSVTDEQGMQNAPRVSGPVALKSGEQINYESTAVASNG